MAEKIKQCPECWAENDETATECKRCKADISSVQATEKGNKTPSSASSFSTSSYLRIMGQVMLGLAVIAALYLVFSYSFVETLSSISSIYNKTEFTPVGLISGAVCLAFGATMHAITRGIAELLEKE